jgi:hypothetical protein
MSECSIFLAPLDWDDIPSWGVVVLRGRSLKATLGRLNLGATVYQLWKQRNDLLHHNTPRTEESIFAQIKGDVRARVLAQGRFRCSRKNLELTARWNINS